MGKGESLSRLKRTKRKLMRSPYFCVRYELTKDESGPLEQPQKFVEIINEMINQKGINENEMLMNMYRNKEDSFGGNMYR
jgi:hypothetical protein